MTAGLRDLFGAEPALDLPQTAGQPWLSVKYGDDPEQVYRVVRAQVADRSVIVKVNPPRESGRP